MEYSEARSYLLSYIAKNRFLNKTMREALNCLIENADNPFRPERDERLADQWTEQFQEAVNEECDARVKRTAAQFAKLLPPKTVTFNERLFDLRLERSLPRCLDYLTNEEGDWVRIGFNWLEVWGAWTGFKERRFDGRMRSCFARAVWRRRKWKRYSAHFRRIRVEELLRQSTDVWEEEAWAMEEPPVVGR